MAPKKRLQGVDDKLQKLLDSNMDEAPARRRAREAFKEIQLGIDHILFKVVFSYIPFEFEFFVFVFGKVNFQVVYGSSEL